MNVSQLYFRNIPSDMTEEKVKPIFEPFGDIKQFTLMKGEKGQYGYVWYEDKTGNDKQHGAQAVNKAVETLSDKDMGDGIKLVVTKYMSKEQREKSQIMGNINFKNAKKKCNLHVKQFPAQWTEEDISRLFSSYGEIESIKIETGQPANTFAFVCFKKPESSTIAKQALAGMNIEGRDLIVNHYEIKEYRDLQKEEAQDQKDWDNYIAQQYGGLQGIDLQN